MLKITDLVQGAESQACYISRVNIKKLYELLLKPYTSFSFDIFKK